MSKSFRIFAVSTILTPLVCLFFAVTLNDLGFKQYSKGRILDSENSSARKAPKRAKKDCKYTDRNLMERFKG